jgi:hypothetical protein
MAEAMLPSGDREKVPTEARRKSKEGRIKGKRSVSGVDPKVRPWLGNGSSLLIC